MVEYPISEKTARAARADGARDLRRKPVAIVRFTVSTS
jgi:hypothetical protein